MRKYLLLPVVFAIFAGGLVCGQKPKPTTQAASDGGPFPASALERAAADFDVRHPPLAIPKEFPKSVPFVSGEADFEGDDNITITDVHGTLDVFAPGNVYQIKGRYTLSSHPRASMSVYVTSKNQIDACTHPQKCNNEMSIDQGQGEFTLVLPMRCEGWPHITLHFDGKNIGNLYFGTADSIASTPSWK